MNSIFEEHEHARRMQDIAYRLVYLRPNRYSEEALVVGVVLSMNEGIYLRRIQSEYAYSLLGQLYGENGKEQISFAIDLLRSEIDQLVKTFDSFESPSDILSLGEVNRGACEHPENFAQDLLEMSSSFYQNYSAPLVSSPYVTQDEMSSSFFNSVTQLDAMKATMLFRGAMVPFSKQSKVKVPIVGERVIGGPVSFLTKQIGSARTQAEALIAKLSIAGRVLKRKSAIYVLAPNSESKINQRDIEASMSELRAVAEGLDVLVRQERSLRELAQALLRDEAA